MRRQIISIYISIASLVIWMVSPVSLLAQKFNYKWERVPMDTTWMGKGTSQVDQIVARYQPQMEDLMEIIGYSSEEMSKQSPQSGLSNLAADALIFAAQPLLKSGDKVFSITNFGGIRSELPKGAIRKYDVFSVFPFDNTVVVLELPGHRVREIVENFAKRGRFEAIGGIEVEVKGDKVARCKVGEENLNNKKYYKLVTIDFLLDG